MAKLAVELQPLFTAWTCSSHGKEALDVVGPFSEWFGGKTRLLPEAGPLPSSTAPHNTPDPREQMENE